MRALRRPWPWLLALAAVLLVAALACEEEEEGGETPTGETPAAETPTAQVTPGPGVSATEIKLGMTNDLAGTGGTPYGVITPAMQAYFQKVNTEDDGVCGRNITLLAEDDQYAPTAALEKTKKLVEQDQVFAIFGALGTGAHFQVAPYLNDPNEDGDTSDGIPDLYVSTGWSGWGDTSQFPWTMGYIPDYVSDAKILAQHINDNFAGQKVGIIYQNDPFGQDYLNGIKEGLDDPSLLVSEQPYEASAPPTAVDSLVGNIQAAGAQVVVMGATPNFTAEAFKYAGTLGFAPQWVISYVNAHTSLARALGGGSEPAQLAAGFQVIAGTISTNYLLSAVEDVSDPAMQEHKRIMETYSGPSLSTLSAVVYTRSP